MKITKRMNPCPFCGEGELEIHGPYITETREWFIQCATCTTTGPNGDSQESAEIQWNKRTWNDAYSDHISRGIK